MKKLLRKTSMPNTLQRLVLVPTAFFLATNCSTPSQITSSISPSPTTRTEHQTVVDNSTPESEPLSSEPSPRKSTKGAMIEVATPDSEAPTPASTNASKSNVQSPQGSIIGRFARATVQATVDVVKWPLGLISGFGKSEAVPEIDL